MFVLIHLRWKIMFHDFFLHSVNKWYQWFSFFACSYYNRAPSGYDFFHDLWKEIARPYELEAGRSPQGPTKIAYVPLSHYKPEEISLEVDNEKVILHGQHQFEREDGFEKSESSNFLRVSIQKQLSHALAEMDRLSSSKPRNLWRKKLKMENFGPSWISVLLNQKRSRSNFAEMS